jgi:DedD protein
LNTRYENERDLHEPIGQDREISLGTTTILGIFFALTLLCAVFFGFGYSLGRRSTPPVPVPITGSDSSIAKPAPGFSADQTASALPPSKPDAGTQSAVVPVDASSNAAQDTQQTPDPAHIKAVHNESAKSPAKPAIVPVVAVTSSGSSVVQVAAMSHQEDANVVAADLKRRGYTVTIRHIPPDKLFHVQIGPFASKKEVDAMRQHLQADGYNSAIAK